MLKILPHKAVDSGDLDSLVMETYGRPYCFQQQEGCRSRGVYYVSVPVEDLEDFEAVEIPEKLNGEEMGVSFAAWASRDPSLPVGDHTEEWAIRMWWERNFYPSLDMMLDDLHKRGLVEEGEYIILVDW